MASRYFCINCENYKNGCPGRGTDSSAVDCVAFKQKEEHDAVNHPSHYCKGGIECLDAIKAALGDNYEGFLAGNVMKYVFRYPDKNGLEDCKKAAFYLDKLIQFLEEKSAKELCHDYINSEYT